MHKIGIYILNIIIKANFVDILHAFNVHQNIEKILRIQENLLKFVIYAKKNI